MAATQRTSNMRRFSCSICYKSLLILLLAVSAVAGTSVNGVDFVTKFACEKWAHPPFSSSTILSASLTLGFSLSLNLYTADDDENYVTCGSFVKIQHKDTGYYLNSEEKQLGGGSGQQIVTFVESPGTHNTLWWVRAADHGDGPEYRPGVTSCQLAEPVACGATIRLTHQDTLRNLHSHPSESALSRQQEVTGFGSGDGRGDGGDNWRVECSSAKDKFWKRDQPVRLKHVDTGKFLGTSAQVEFNAQTCGPNCPIMNHLEAFGRSSADAHSLMKVVQGIHLSR